MRTFSQDLRRNFFGSIPNLSPNDFLSIDINDDGTGFEIEIVQRTGSGTTWPSYVAQRRFLERFPERKQLHGIGKWAIPATDIAVELIDKVWPKDQMSITDEAKTLFGYLKLTLQASMYNAERVGRYTAKRVVPEHDYELHPDFPLAGYQQLALVNSMSTEGYGLFMEQGTGKTPVVIARVCNEAQMLRAGKLYRNGHSTDIDKLKNDTARTISEEVEAITERGEAQLKRKKKKLIDAARKAAARRQVSLNFEGAADELLRRAEIAVLEAKRFLADRMREIDLYMKDLEIAWRFELNRRIDAIKARHTRDLRIAIDAIEAKAAAANKTDRMYRALIIAPNNVRLNWESEFKKFTTTTGMVTVVRGGEVDRVKCFIDAFTPDDECNYTAVIVSYESAIRMWSQLKLVEWDLAVLDEGHYIKNKGTKRFKFARDLRDISRARMLLTGTPITNTALDLYTQLEFLGENWSGFKSWESFRRFYGRFETTGNGYEKVVGVQNLPFMQDRLARYAFTIRKSEALPNLPEKVYDIVEVEMTADQRRAYQEMATMLAAQIKDMLEKDDRQMTVNNALTRLLRLAQITSGFATIDAVYSDEGEVLRPKEIHRYDPNPKLEALVDLIKDEPATSKTIIWACWVQDIRSIAARLRMEGIKCVTFYGGNSEKEKVEAERAFNYDRETKVFIGNPAAGGVGLNLLGHPPTESEGYETDCDHEIYFSQNWSPTARSQSEDRAHRRGTRKPVRITDLCVPGTIDEEIRARVLQKQTNALVIGDIRDILLRLVGTQS